MALEINDFKDDKLSVEDYTIKQDKSVALNKRTSAQLAAAQTVLSAGSVEEYEDTKADLLDPSRRQNFLLKQHETREAIFNDAKGGMIDAVADPTLSQETKQSIVSGGTTGYNLGMKAPTLNSLAEEAIVADSGSHESARSAEGRNLLLESVNRVTAHKREMTKLINGMNVDEGVVSKVVDHAELMAPFAEWIHFDRLLKEVKGESSTNLLGQQKQELYDHIKGQPLEKRAEMAEALIDLLQDNDSVVLPDGNDVITVDALENMLVENDYSDFERYFDNVTSVLDTIGVGALLRTATKGVKGARVVAEVGEVVPSVKAGQEAKVAQEAEWMREQSAISRKATSTYIRSEVIPTSPAEIVKDYNPEVARDMYKMALEDETGESAQALFGTSREEVISKVELPEPEMVEGVMPNKVEMRRPAGDMDKDLERAYKKDGVTILSETEMSSLRTHISAGLEEVQGMVMHPSSMTVRVNADETTRFTARYSPLDSGFETPQEAIDSAEVAFRAYGLGPEHFSILARRGDEWVETSIKDLDAEAVLKAAGAPVDTDSVDYAIGLKYDYKFNPDDLDLVQGELNNLVTSPGIFAKGLSIVDEAIGDLPAKLGQGSIQQNLLDSASVIHPQIQGAASVAVDKTQFVKRLFIQQFDEFSEGYAGLSRNRRAAMTDYIHKANLEGLPLDVAELATKFDDKEISLLKKWRKANDTMWHVANDDMIVSLRSRGLKMFTHKGSDTNLVGYPKTRGSVKAGAVFDVNTNKIVNKTSGELDTIYDSGGELVELAEAIEVDGQWIDRVVSDNTSAGGFTRAIRDGETVLAYRDGYYPVMYDANIFLYKKVKGADGKEFTKVFASAKSQTEATELLGKIQKAEKLSDEDMGKTYGSRKDRRIDNPNNSLFDEGAWNVSANTGLSAQRLRGKRLESAGADYQSLGKEHLKDPLEAIARQVQTLSQRVSMRTTMDAMKKRWLLKYSDALELKTNPKTGKAELPKGIADIKGKDGANGQLVRDAKTNYNYISSLENGYINGIDKAYRGAMHKAADGFDKFGLGKAASKAYAAADTSPANAAKTMAFKLFISSNPARQAVVQRGQMFMLGVHNPKYAATELIPDLLGVDAVRIGASSNPKYVALAKEIEESGVMDAVEAHELIRTDLLRLADLSAAQKAKTAVMAPLEFLQKSGFGYAEQDVLLSGWLSARNKALKAGKDLKSQRVKDEILAETRSFTLAMNRAGEMPYSQSTLGIATQFLSFQHKALLQGVSNKSLTGPQRAKLMGYSTAMFGIGATPIGIGINSLFPDQPSEVKDALKAGLVDTTLNSALTAMSGEAQAIDFGDFAPTEVYGLGNVFYSLLDDSLSEMIVKSPSGSLLFGANPRLTEAFKTGYKFFYPPANYEEELLHVGLPDVLHSSMNLFSGYSSVFKANYAYHTGQKMASSGRITDSDVTKVEAVATLFGFRTKTEEGSRLATEIEYGDTPFSGNDLDMWYGELKRHLARRFDTTSEKELAEATIREAWTVFGEDREYAVRYILGKIQSDAKDGDYKLTTRILKRMGVKNNDETWEMINALPASPQRQMLVDSMNMREEMNNGS